MSSGLRDLNLIHFFDFYLMLVFLAATVRRLGQYWNAANLVLKGPTRWPRLFELVKQNRTILLTWGTVAPALLALVLSVAQLVASFSIWPEAKLTVGDLMEHREALVLVGIVGLAMLAVDIYFILVVTEVDKAETEKSFDQAEFWLRSKAAHVVRVVTFGFLNPRQKVADEVRKALTEATHTVSATMWWVSVQMGLRVLFGLGIWLTWAAYGSNAG